MYSAFNYFLLHQIKLASSHNCCLFLQYLINFFFENFKLGNEKKSKRFSCACSILFTFYVVYGFYLLIYTRERIQQSRRELIVTRADRRVATLAPLGPLGSKESIFKQARRLREEKNRTSQNTLLVDVMTSSATLSLSVFSVLACLNFGSTGPDGPDGPHGS